RRGGGCWGGWGRPPASISPSWTSPTPRRSTSCGRARTWAASSCAAIPGRCAAIHRRCWPRPGRRRCATAGARAPRRAASGGRAAYVTDFIVRADSPYVTLADTFGGRIAYSTEHSHSGYNAPRYHLLAHLTPKRRALYRTVLGPFVRQRPCLDAIVKGEADVA